MFKKEKELEVRKVKFSREAGSELGVEYRKFPGTCPQDVRGQDCPEGEVELR